MGMATSDVSKLIAANSSDEEICRSINADSIGFNAVEDIEQAVNDAREASAVEQPLGSLCTSCATGNYPLKSATFRALAGNKLVSLGLPSVR